MPVQEILDRANQSVSVREVFGEPYEKDGITIIPVARVSAGGGGGTGMGGEGMGHGYGMKAEPVGAYVIRGGDAVWRPAVNVNRIVTGAFIVAVVAMWKAPRIIKTASKALG